MSGKLEFFLTFLVLENLLGLSLFLARHKMYVFPLGSSVTECVETDDVARKALWAFHIDDVPGKRVYSLQFGLSIRLFRQVSGADPAVLLWRVEYSKFIQVDFISQGPFEFSVALFREKVSKAHWL